MGERALENRIKKLQELENQEKAIKEQADKLREEIKRDMEAKGTDELQAGSFIVRWKTIMANRFDSKTFQAEHKKMYEQYVKQSTSRRFTIA